MERALNRLGWSLFFGGVLLLLASIAYQAQLWYRAGAWVEVEATVHRIEKTVPYWKGWDSQTLYFNYQFGGRHYQGDYRRGAADVRVGQRVAVLVDPANPGAALRRRGDAISFNVLIVSLGAYLFAAWIAYLVLGGIIGRRASRPG